MSPQYIIYLVGVMTLGLFYEPVNSALGGKWLFVLVVLAYLLTLRLIGYWVQKRRLTGGKK